MYSKLYSVANPEFPVGGADLQCRRFSVKTYAKTKELDPVGGGGARAGSAPWIRQWYFPAKIMERSYTLM